MFNLPGLLLTLVFLASLGFLIRALARIPFYWTFTPANTGCLIVTDDNPSRGGGTGGGNLVGVLHAIPGKHIDTRSDPDAMNWEVKPGKDPAHNAVLYRLLGVQSMGSIFHTTRVNTDRRMRFAREEEAREEQRRKEGRIITSEELRTITKVDLTRHVYYSGELTVTVKEADTSDRLGLDFEIDFVFERQFFVKSILRLADSAAFLTSMVEKIVNHETASREAEDFLGGEKAAANREMLTNLIVKDNTFSPVVLKELGLNITSVSLRTVTMSESHRALLELKVKAEKEGEANIIEARNEAEAQKLRNDADADRVERVIKPAAQSEWTVRVREAEAYENNQTVTTYAPNRNLGVMVGTSEGKGKK